MPSSHSRWSLVLLVGSSLISMGVFSSLASSGITGNLLVLPGRPTILVSSSTLEDLLLFFLLGEVLGALGFYLVYRRIWYSLLLTLLALLSLYSSWFSAIYLIAILVLARSILARTAPFIVLLASLLALTPPSLVGNSVPALGWALLGFGLVASLVLGVGVVASIPLTNSITSPSSEGSYGAICCYRRGLAGRLLLVASILIAVSSVLVPHARASGIVSLDTIYNLRYCLILDRGSLATVLVEWQRPLYSLVLCVLPRTIGAGLYELVALYDIILPLSGLILIALVAWLFSSWAGLRDPLVKGFSSLLSVSYWAPFFIYAGLQTNLFSLPLIVMLAYYGWRLLENTSFRRVLVLSVVSVILGAWHPWSLAYASISAMLLVIFTRLWNARKLAALMIGLLSGWAVHTAVAVPAGYSGVVGVALAGFTHSSNLYSTLGLFMWGTGLRGEIFLPLSITLLEESLAGRIERRRLWLVALTAPAYMGLFLRDLRLLPRLLVDAPAPLLLAMLYSKRPWVLLVLASSSLAAWAYLIILAPINSYTIPSQ